MKTLRLLTLFTFLILIYSCDETSLTREEILTDSWMLDATTLNGDDIIDENLFLKSSTYTFVENRTVQIIISQSSEIINGEWGLLDGEKKLELIISGQSKVYDIDKIDNNNLWLMDEVEQDSYLYKFSKLKLE